MSAFLIQVPTAFHLHAPWKYNSLLQNQLLGNEFHLMYSMPFHKLRDEFDFEGFVRGHFTLAVPPNYMYASAETARMTCVCVCPGATIGSLCNAGADRKSVV